MDPIRVYADTSVFGGVFDEEFETASRAFFEQVRAGRFRLVVSAIIDNELRDAPEPVRLLFDEMQQTAEVADVTESVVQLQQAYLDAGIVGARWETDALHVALASEAQCAIIVSWNFKHIVSFKKIPLYNGVNLVKGCRSIAIHTPQEVIGDENEDV
jgi:predicted nucleic acid-binding protein